MNKSTSSQQTDNLRLSVKDHVSYKDDLINNLVIQQVKNPSYVCDQFSNSCKTLSNKTDQMQCEKSWAKVCPDIFKNR